MQNRIRFKIGEIEFEAEGSAEIVERERSVFLSALLPAAVDAIVRTRGVEQAAQYIEAIEQPAMLLPTANNSEQGSIESIFSPSADLSRTSLAEFTTQKGATSHNDFILCAAYFDEKKNGVLVFSLENIKKYYEDARRKAASNPSHCLNTLASRGLIVDSPEHKGALPKVYKLSNSGLSYVEAMQPKEGKELKVTTKPRKLPHKPESVYSAINVDELNLQAYPSVKTIKGFKEKMILILYIITNEQKGEWFTTADVLCLMTDIFGEPATRGQVKGVFNREKLFFKAEKVDGNNKEIRRKLLNGGVSFATGLMQPVN